MINKRYLIYNKLEKYKFFYNRNIINKLLTLINRSYIFEI